MGYIPTHIIYTCVYDIYVCMCIYIYIYLGKVTHTWAHVYIYIYVNQQMMVDYIIVELKKQ